MTSGIIHGCPYSNIQILPTVFPLLSRRTFLKDPLRSYLQQWVFYFFFPLRVKRADFLERCQVALHWDWKAGRLEIQRGQCLDSNLSWSKACHRQPWRCRQRRWTIIFQREPLKHLGAEALHSPGLPCWTTCQELCVRLTSPTQCE